MPMAVAICSKFDCSYVVIGNAVAVAASLCMGALLLQHRSRHSPCVVEKQQRLRMLFSAHERHLITNNLTLKFKKSARRTLPAWVGRMRKCTYKSVLAVGLCAIGITLSYSVKSSAQSGIASVHSGGRTASGEYVRSQELTAAHRSLPFGTKVRVTNYRTGRSVVVRINDRGPFVRGRIIDVTPAAARALGFSGLARVSLEVVAQD